MKKIVNLVVFIDGSGNDAMEEPMTRWTNVARLWNACREGKSTFEVEEQRVFYRKGVGTRRNELVRGGFFGRYLRDRVNEARTWLDNEVELATSAGREPRIFLFGFSRGAYAVRVLAEEIRVPVWFMGVWDTVKATLTGPEVDAAGINVRRVYHAIDLDEHRRLFDVKRFKMRNNVTEVWFPGCHADVGGGYEECGLSLFSLNLMVSIAEDYGLIVDARKIPVAPPTTRMPVIHDETKKLGWQLVGLMLRDSKIDRLMRVGDLVHWSAYELQKVGYKRWIPLSCERV